MPVGFSSAARNLFLLGSTGAVASNFFKQVDESSNALGTWIPRSIIYNSSDQKYIVGGYNKDSNTKDRGWISKRDYDIETDPENPTTTQEWNVESTYSVPNGGSVRFNSVKLDVNDKVIVAGDYNAGTGNLPLVARYSATGVLEWQATSYYNGRATDITSDDNNYYICGTNDLGEAFVEKYDTNGYPLWSQIVSTGANDETRLESIGVNDRGHVVAGGALDATNPQRGYLIKINTDTGEVLWDKTFSRAYDENGTFGYNAPVKIWELYVDSRDQIYVTGTYGSPERQWIAKLTPEGNIIWQKGTNNTTNVLDGLSITPMGIRSDGETEQTIVLSKQVDTIQTYLLLSKYSKDGELVWRRKLDKGTASSASPLRTYGISLDADPSFYYVSYVDQSFNAVSGTPDTYYFGKVSSSGNGLGAFDYDDGSAVTLEYTIYSGNTDAIERIKDGSVRYDTSDMMSYPFGANQLVFDDLATPVTNKKRQVTQNNSVDLTLGSSMRIAEGSEINLVGHTGVVDTGLGPLLLVDSRGDNVVGGSMRNIAGQASSNYNAWSNTNATWDSTVAGGAWDFDDSSPSRMSFDISPFFNTAADTPFTLEVWAQRDDSNSWQTIVSIATSWTQIAFDSNNRIACGRNGGGGGINARAGLFTTEADRWYHIAMTYDGNDNGTNAYIDIYVDGVKTKSKIDMGVNGNSNGSNLYLGRHAGDGEFLDGYVGEVRLYNRELNELEVAQNYNASKERFTGEPQFGKVLTNDVDVSWVDQSNGYKAYVGNTSPGYSASDGSWEFDGNGTNLRDHLTIDIEEFTVYGWEMWFENYDTINNNDNSIGGPSGYQVLASWAYPAGITLGGWTSSATNEAITFWSRENGAGGGDSDATYTRTEVPPGNHHLFVRWNGSTYDIFVDGVQQTVYNLNGGNAAQLVTYTGKCIHIGGNNSTYFFHGKIFETRLYQKQISEAQVLQNYNATKSRYLNEKVSSAPKVVGDAIVVDNNLILNYDFANRACIDGATNLFPKSFEPGVSWSGAGPAASIITKNTTEVKAPDGTYTATKWEITGPDPYFYHQGTLTTTKTYTMSIWVKAGTNMAGDVLQQRMGAAPYSTNADSTIPADGSWKRITFTKTITNGGNDETNVNIGWEPQTNPSGNPSSGDVIYVWGPQLEEAWSSPTYVPTYGTTKGVPTTVNNLANSSSTGTIDGATFANEVENYQRGGIYPIPCSVSGSTVTVTETGHPLITGQTVRIKLQLEVPNTVLYNYAFTATYTITGTTSNTFTYDLGSSNHTGYTGRAFYYDPAQPAVIERGCMYFGPTTSQERISFSDAGFAVGTGDYTIEMWVHHTEPWGQQTYFSDEWGDTAGPYFAKKARSGNNNKVGLYYSSGWTLEGTTDLVDNIWYHVVVSRISGTSNLYVNATSEDSASDTVNITNTDMYIGDSPTSSGQMAGYIGETRFYTKGLTATEISKNFNATRAKYGV